MRIDESLYFANENQLERHLLNEVAERPQIDHLVLVFSAVNYVDASATETLGRLNEELAAAGVDMHLAEVKERIMHSFSKTDFPQLLKAGCIYASTHEAIEALNREASIVSHITDQVGICNGNTDTTVVLAVAGPLIGLTAPALLLLVGKPFGISSSFRHLASMCSPKTRVAYLRDNDWRGELWSIVFVLGVIIGRRAAHYLSNSAVIYCRITTASGLVGCVFLSVDSLSDSERATPMADNRHSIMGLSN